MVFSHHDSHADFTVRHAVQCGYLNIEHRAWGRGSKEPLRLHLSRVVLVSLSRHNDPDSACRTRCRAVCSLASAKSAGSFEGGCIRLGSCLGLGGSGGLGGGSGGAPRGSGGEGCGCEGSSSAGAVPALLTPPLSPPLSAVQSAWAAPTLLPAVPAVPAPLLSALSAVAAASLVAAASAARACLASACAALAAHTPSAASAAAVASARRLASKCACERGLVLGLGRLGLGLGWWCFGARLGFGFGLVRFGLVWWSVWLWAGFGLAWQRAGSSVSTSNGSPLAG